MYKFFVLTLILFYSATFANSTDNSKNKIKINEKDGKKIISPFTFKDIPLKNLIKIIIETTKKTIIYSEDDLKNKKATIITKKEIDLDALWEMFEGVLSLNKLTLVKKKNFYTIIKSKDAAKSPIKVD